MALGELVVKLSADIAQFQSAMDRSQQIAENAMKKIDGAAGLVKNTLIGLGAGFAAGLTFDAIAGKIEGVIASAAGLQQLSERTGATVENLSSLVSIAKLSDTSTDQLATGLQKLSKNMADAAAGGEKSTAAFAAIGISTKEIKTLAPDEMFLKIANQLGLYKDGAGKTAEAQLLLGKSGANLLPVMKDLADVGEFQTKVTSEQAQMADEYEKNLKRLHASTDAIFKIIGLQLIPVFDAFTKTLMESQNANDGVRSSVKGLADDGSIRTWAEGAALAAGYVIDVFSAVIRVFEIVGKGIGATAAMANLAAHGEFSAAAQVAREYAKDVDAIWNKELFSDKLKRQFAESHKTTGASVARPELRVPGAALSGGADDPSRKILEGQLKTQEAVIAQEKELLQTRNQFLELYYNEGYITLADYYERKDQAQQDALKVTEAAYDKEIADLRAHIAITAKESDKQADLNKIADITNKRAAAEAAAAKESQLNWLRQQKGAEDYRKKLDDINAQLLEMQGNKTAAAVIRLDDQNLQFRRGLVTQQTTGTDDEKARATATLAQLDRIRAMTIAQKAFDDQQTASGFILDTLSNKEKAYQLAQQSGEISGFEAMRLTGEARQAEIANLTQLADQMDVIAQKSGDPRLITGAEQFRLKIEEMAQTTDLLGKKFQDVFEGSFEDALLGFLNHTKTLKQSLLDMGTSITQGINKMVVQNIGEQLFAKEGPLGGIGGFFSGLFGGKGGSSNTIAATTMQTAATVNQTAATLMQTAAASMMTAATTMAASGGGAGALAFGGGFLPSGAFVPNSFGAAGSSITSGAEYVPFLAAGIDYVPNDMLAYIHKGEAIVPNDGRADAYRSGRSGGARVTNNFIVQGAPSRDTQQQVANAAFSGSMRAYKRNS